MTNQSTKEMLSRYNQELKKSLNEGINYTDVLEKLVQTDDKDVLLESSQKLGSWKLNNQYLTYPQQYSQQDYYLLFINRLFEQHNEGAELSVANDVEIKGLLQQIVALGQNIGFYFKMNDNENGGAFYYATHSEQPILYLNLNKKFLSFNSRELTHLFLTRLYGDFELEGLLKSINILHQFGDYLVKDYDFKVDFSLVAKSNYHFYEFVSKQISKEALDKLFIIAAEHNYMLKSYEENGAQLTVDDVTIDIFQNNNDQWGMKIIDKNNDVSLIEMLLKYDFLRQWYLNNLNVLEVGINDLIFS